MKLGSLFDGSGGFPLAGVLNGIEPVWASEIETYPLKVTAARFPHMKPLGDVTKIDGAKIEPVDIITFGSPCQDLSIAGKQAGIHEGTRSSLFFEAIRIIKEMRDATADEFPRYAVWENVPGAFSSHGGEDFRAVLQALCEVNGRDVYVPKPARGGKWRPAGCIVGDGYSIAWRVYDAQYWGVPQRRKRIYLIADFADERAGEILFERESVSGNSQPGEAAREGTAADAERGAGRGCSPVYCLQGNGIDRADTAGCNGKGWREDQCYTLNTIDRPAVAYFTRQAIGEYVDGDVASSVCARDYKDATDLVVYPEIARSLCARHDSSPCIDRGQNIVCYAPSQNYCAEYDKSDVSATLQTSYHYGTGGDAAMVVHDCRGNGDGKTVPTLTGDHQNRVTDYTSIVTGRSDKPPRKYIVRRLTPLECCRLQGFPDWWTDGVEGSDSAQYKMWGNGIALPCAMDVLRRIKDYCVTTEGGETTWDT